jgi:tellurite resistance protein
MSQLIRTIAEIYAIQLERHRNRDFLRAAMAACALVAMASGRVSLRDRVHVDRVLETLDALKVFDPHEGVGLFNEYVARLEADAIAGRRAVLDLVAEEVAKEPEKAELLARICLATSAPQLEGGEAQRQALADLCRCIGVSPGFCALSEDGRALGGVNDV